jgi:L-malate glycosyltransferase
VLLDVFSSKNIWYALYISLLAKKTGLPYTLILRGGSMPQKAAQSPRLIHLLFSGARHIIAPSGYLCDAFKPSWPQTTLIPNIVESSKYIFRQREIGVPKILYLRGFGKVYNPQMLIHAIHMLKTEFPGIEAAMMGNNHGDKTLEDCQRIVSESGLTENIKIYGSMSKEQWIALSGNFNIMVSTPMIDNTPVSVIEGMMLGLPVISTNVGGISYLIDHGVNGLLIEAANSAQLAEAIRSLAGNPILAAEIALAARKKAESFGWDNVKSLWEKILRPNG